MGIEAKGHEEGSSLPEGEPGAGMSLSQLYAELNTRFFGGRLPRFRVTHCASPRLLLKGFEGECLDSRRLIRLRRGLEPNRVRQVLLHEMCHIGAPPGHGPRFQANLLQLVAQGETWAAEELERVRHAHRWNELVAQARLELDELASISPRPSFRRVVRWLAEETFFRRPPEVLQVAPWLRQAWEKACREADQMTKLRAARFGAMSRKANTGSPGQRARRPRNWPRH